MEISLFVLAAIIILLVIVIYGLGKRYHQAQNRIKELEMDLQEYVDASLKDARTINELNKKLEERTTR